VASFTRSLPYCWAKQERKISIRHGARCSERRIAINSGCHPTCNDLLIRCARSPPSRRCFPIPMARSKPTKGLRCRARRRDGSDDEPALPVPNRRTFSCLRNPWGTAPKRPQPLAQF
jgi:hypothetical protein